MDVTNLLLNPSFSPPFPNPMEVDNFAHQSFSFAEDDEEDTEVLFKIPSQTAAKTPAQETPEERRKREEEELKREIQEEAERLRAERLQREEEERKKRELLRKRREAKGQTAAKAVPAIRDESELSEKELAARKKREQQREEMRKLKMQMRGEPAQSDENASTNIFPASSVEKKKESKGDALDEFTQFLEKEAPSALTTSVVVKAQKENDMEKENDVVLSLSTNDFGSDFDFDNVDAFLTFSPTRTLFLFHNSLSLSLSTQELLDGFLVFFKNSLQLLPTLDFFIVFLLEELQLFAK